MSTSLDAMQAYLTPGKVESILDTDNRELRDALGLVLSLSDGPK